MKTEETYIVISHYAFYNNNIMLTFHDTIEDALKNAREELKATSVTNVQIYESDKAEYCFWGRMMFEYKKEENL